MIIDVLNPLFFNDFQPWNFSHLSTQKGGNLVGKVGILHKKNRPDSGRLDVIMCLFIRERSQLSSSAPGRYVCTLSDSSAR